MGDMADDLYDAMERDMFCAGQRESELDTLSLPEFIAAMKSWQSEIGHSVIASMIDFWTRTGRLTDKQRRFATSIMAEADCG